MYVTTSVIILYFFVVFPNQGYVFHPKGSVAKTMATVVSSVAVSQFATYGKYDVYDVLNTTYLSYYSPR